MPQAVTHVLVPMVLLSLFRSFCVKYKEKFPLHYILIGGIAGLLPDLDVAIYYILCFFGFTADKVHRTFSHTIFFALFFVLLGVFTLSLKNRRLGRHHLKLSTVFFVISFGIFTHLLLDFLVVGLINPLYPLINQPIGLNLIKIFPLAWQDSIVPSLDAILLVFWIIHMELRHRISDFV